MCTTLFYYTCVYIYSLLNSCGYWTLNKYYYYLLLLSDVSMAVVSASDVLDSLKAVKLGKAAGIDGLCAEHFVCAHTSVSVHLSLLFNSI